MTWHPLDLLPDLVRFDMFAYASMGAFVLWLRLEYGADLKVQLEQLVNDIVNSPFTRSGLGTALAVILFIGIGGFLSMIVVGPISSRQALAAGMACTTLIGSLAPATRKKSSAAQPPRGS